MLGWGREVVEEKERKTQRESKNHTRCIFFLQSKSMRRQISRSARSSSAHISRRRIRQHLPGTAQEEFRDRNQRSLLDPHRATLQVYLPFFVTDNFITSQRLKVALQQSNFASHHDGRTPSHTAAVCARALSRRSPLNWRKRGGDWRHKLCVCHGHV